MEWIIIGGVILVILIAYTIYNRKSMNRKIRIKLEKLWGEVPSFAYTEEKRKALKFYYEKKVKKPETDVDDITWHDLDMDQIYMTVNNTASSVGDEYMYAWLRSPSFDIDELEERNRVALFFEKNKEARLDVLTELYKLGKTKNISIYEYMHRLESIPYEDNLGHIIKILCFFMGVALCFIYPVIGIIATIVIAGVNVFTYFSRKKEIEPYLNIVSFIMRWIDCSKKISSMDIKEIEEYRSRLKKSVASFRSFRAGAAIIAPANPNGDLLQMLLDYMRMLFHIDLLKFNSMLKAFAKKSEEFDDMFAVVGFLDSAISIASFRELMSDYSIPKLEKTDKPFIDAEELYHPMISDPVTNSIKESGCALITGSNASGKSTFIRTVGINAILAQTIYTVMAYSYNASFFRIASSMALSDNLLEGESYYIVEIKSLKRLLDGIRDDVPSLIFVDEVLRGTNTLERIAASSRILYSFAGKNVMCFAATHDIELTYILEEHYANYHFEEKVENDNVVFDYELHEGRAVSRNAIKLLKMMGYSDGIINSAYAAADRFLSNGEWDRIE